MPAEIGRGIEISDTKQPSKNLYKSASLGAGIPTDKLPFRQRAGVRLSAGVLAALPLAGCTDAVPFSPPQEPTSEVARPITPVEKQEQEVRQEIQKTGKEAALSVLADMANLNAGTESYTPTKIGNKPAIIGSDRVPNTADDAQYRGVPEMMATFDPSNQIIDVEAVSEDIKDINEKDKRFSSIKAIFKVDPANPIASDNDQFTPVDFMLGVAGEKTQLEGLSVTYKDDFSPQSRDDRYSVSLVSSPMIGGNGLDGQSLSDEILKGEKPTVKENPDLFEARTPGDLETMRVTIEQLADKTTYQLAKDTAGGNK